MEVKHCTKTSTLEDREWIDHALVCLLQTKETYVGERVDTESGIPLKRADAISSSRLVIPRRQVIRKFNQFPLGTELTQFFNWAEHTIWNPGYPNLSNLNQISSNAGGVLFYWLKLLKVIDYRNTGKGSLVMREGLLVTFYRSYRLIHRHLAFIYNKLLLLIYWVELNYHDL